MRVIFLFFHTVIQKYSTVQCLFDKNSVKSILFMKHRKKISFLPSFDITSQAVIGKKYFFFVKRWQHCLQNSTLQSAFVLVFSLEA